MELSQDDCLLRPEHFAAVSEALRHDSREAFVKGLSEVELSVLAAVRVRAGPSAAPTHQSQILTRATHTPPSQQSTTDLSS